MKRKKTSVISLTDKNKNNNNKKKLMTRKSNDNRFKNQSWSIRSNERGKDMRVYMSRIVCKTETEDRGCVLFCFIIIFDWRIFLFFVCSEDYRENMVYDFIDLGEYFHAKHIQFVKSVKNCNNNKKVKELFSRGNWRKDKQWFPFDFTLCKMQVNT